MKRLLILLLGLILVLVALVGAFAYLQIRQTTTGQGSATPGTTPTPGGSPTFIPNGLPRAQEGQVVDANGHPLLLRGSEVDSSAIYIKNWNQGNRPSDLPLNNIFHTMATVWKMNIVRLPISNWIYAQNSAEYLKQIDEEVQQANSNGLYVVLALHDDQKAGSPYQSKQSTIPKTVDVTFWQAIASHYKTNPMVMYDLYNEPYEPNWSTWYKGGGTTPDGQPIVGFQTLVDAIRSVGAEQIIIVEPGSAGKGKGSGTPNATLAEEGGWSNFPASDEIRDPNIMYSLHVYQKITESPAAQSAKWGPLLGHVPLYYGEWAFIPNVATSAGLSHCTGIAHDQAPQYVTNFLNFMNSIHANWSAWQFAPHLLVQDYTTFTPTSLSIPWVCGNAQYKDAGMGDVIKQFLTAHQ